MSSWALAFTRSIAEHNHVQILASNESEVAIGPLIRPWPRYQLCLAVTHALSARSFRGRPHSYDAVSCSPVRRCLWASYFRNHPQGVILRLVTKACRQRQSAIRTLIKRMGLRPRSVENVSCRFWPWSAPWSARTRSARPAPEQLTHTLARGREWLQC